MSTLDIIAVQPAAIEPENLQSAIIEHMAEALLCHPSPPCLLRAPTGSGKTYIFARAGRGQCGAPDLVAVVRSLRQSGAADRGRTGCQLHRPDADGDDEVRTLAAFVARAPVHGLTLGVVVDEAHLGLDKLPNLAGSCFGWRWSVQTVRESKLAQ